MNEDEKPCEFCATKHIGTAHAYMIESVLGYPENRCWAIGELALAESHLVRKWPAQADRVRAAHKILLEHPDVMMTEQEWTDLAISTMALIGKLTEEDEDLLNEINRWGAEQK